MCQVCGDPRGVLKPDIVFFGEDLADEFHERMIEDRPEVYFLLCLDLIGKCSFHIRLKFLNGKCISYSNVWTKQNDGNVFPLSWFNANTFSLLTIFFLFFFRFRLTSLL